MKRQSDRAFGLTVAAVLAMIFGFVWLVLDRVLIWSAAASVAFLMVALTAPGILLPLNRLWVALTHRLGTINNAVLLGAFYFIIVTPLGMILRTFGWDPMRLSMPRTASYWTAVGRDADPDTLRDMF